MTVSNSDTRGSITYPVKPGGEKELDICIMCE